LNIIFGAGAVFRYGSAPAPTPAPPKLYGSHCGAGSATLGRRGRQEEDETVVEGKPSAILPEIVLRGASRLAACIVGGGEGSLENQ
jgi:hypothetical protein